MDDDSDDSSSHNETTLDQFREKWQIELTTKQSQIPLTTSAHPISSKNHVDDDERAKNQVNISLTI